MTRAWHGLCASVLFFCVRRLGRAGAHAAAQRVQARATRHWMISERGRAWVDARERR